MKQEKDLYSKPPEETKIDLMQVLGKITEAYGTIKSILEIFGIGAAEPSLQDILTQIINEIRDVFKQELANEDLRTATATLQNIQDFISENYANAVNNNESTQQLYTLLTQDNSAPSLSNFAIIINKITSWASEFATNPGLPQQNIACQALSFSLTSYYYLALVYKERAKVYWTSSPGPDDRRNGSNAEWANMQTTADKAIKQLSPILKAFVEYRYSTIKIELKNYALILIDHYLPDCKSLSVTELDDPILDAHIAAYKQALKTGNDEDMAALQNTLTSLASLVDAPFGIKEEEIREANEYYNSVKDDVKKFGQWYANATNTLNTFKKITTDINPYVSGA